MQGKVKGKGGGLETNSTLRGCSQKSERGWVNVDVLSCRESEAVCCKWSWLASSGHAPTERQCAYSPVAMLACSEWFESFGTCLNPATGILSS